MGILTELKGARRESSEGRRRWYSSAAMDLIVWYGDDDAVQAFELYYDKGLREHVFIWREDRGFTHLAVDDGEQKPALDYKESPILVPDGHIDSERIHRLFEAANQNLPDSLRSLVLQKLAEHPGSRP